MRYYLDNLIVVSLSQEEHLEHLHHLFEVLRDVCLTIKKCIFARNEINCLGYTIFRD